MGIDPVVFGHRLRHFRKQKALTLDDLGERIGRPAPFLSLVENGKREPKLSQISDLADALEVELTDLLSPEAPSRRAELEIAVEHAQNHPRYRALDLPPLRITAKVPDDALAHIVRLFGELTDRDQPSDISELRRANAKLGDRLTALDGHLPEIEEMASETVARSGYVGVGPLTTKNISEIISSLGFRVRSVDDMPVAARAVVDHETKTIYVPQRNELRTRQARKAVLQTVATTVLDLGEPRSADELLRQRLWTSYYAAAVLIPESSGAKFLDDAKQERDLSIADLREHFYVSHEMAAQRFTNLATRHLGLRTHFVRSDAEGIIRKAYANDNVPFPVAEHGSEGLRLCRRWGARAAFSSVDKFAVHHQFTHTPIGSFWCSTHVVPGDDGHAFTVGVRFENARLFRGRTTDIQAHSDCPDGLCCRSSTDDDSITVFARSQNRLIALLTPGLTTPIEQAALTEFVENHRDVSASSGVIDPSR